MRRALDEYEVAGIKTTLPFFREIVRDEEFKSGQLDTGFISRFNQRRSAAGAAGSAGQGTGQTQGDIALIAAAIHYARLQREASRNRQTPAGNKSSWKMSGRIDSMAARDLMSIRDKRSK